MPKKVVEALKKKGYSEESAHRIAYSQENKPKRPKKKVKKSTKKKK